MTARLRDADCDEGSLCLDAACVSQREGGAAGEGRSGTFFLVVDWFFGTAFDVDLAWSVERP